MSTLSQDDIGALVALIDANRLAEAEVRARTLLGRQPEFGLLWKLLSVALLRQGKDALPALERAAALLPQDAEAQRNLGSALYGERRYAEALVSLRRALQVDPKDIGALVRAANSLQELGQIPDAVTLYQEALRLDRGQPDVLNNLGNALMSLGEARQAAAAYRFALELKPGDAHIHSNLDNALRQSVEAGYPRIRALMEQRQFAKSLAAAEALERQVPGDREVLLAIAVSQRMLQKIPDALATLDRLEQRHPNFSRLHEERGHCHAAREDAARAIPAYLRAVNINPALPESWSTLEGLYRMTGEADNSRMAAAHVTALRRLPAELVTASSLFSDGDLPAAESLIRAFLTQRGEHVEALRLLGRIALQRAVLDDAQALFERVLALAPGYRAARFDYASALIEQQRFHQARVELEQLLGVEPRNALYLSLYATACAGCGAHEQAVTIYRDLIGTDTAPPMAHVSLGNALKTLGRTEEAVAAYRAAAALREDFGMAYWSLANLKTYRFSEEEIARMRTAERAPTTAHIDRYHLCFALGGALEHLGEYADSYAYYERGNALKSTEITYRPQPERHMRRQSEVCTRDFFASRTGVGCPRADPIFIVGLPRAGSTLIEQILASHSRIEGTRELIEIPRLVMELQGRDPERLDSRYPGVLADLPPGECRRLGEKYLAATGPYRSDKPHFIDKLSGNFRHIGLIHLILPRAKIIDARREPMACCFGNFKQLFASGQEFTYRLEDLARYYRSYLELMRHWDRALPGRILRVQHEDVVEDLEGSVRRLLDFCELEFEPSCVEFHKTGRSILTASSEQVRRPIFRESLDQWKHYAPWLGPLEDALGDAVTRYRE